LKSNTIAIWLIKLNMISEIQGKILAIIARSDGMRYSEAYPGEEIDDDLYNYHLQELVRRGYLEKLLKIYQLTDKGKKELVYLDSKGEEMEKFKIVLLLVVTRNDKKEILIRKRKKSPHRGEISTLSGKAKLGEDFVETAKKRLMERTGLMAEFEHWGDFRVIRRTSDGDVFEDMIFCVCTATEPSGKLIESDGYGDNWWDNFDKIYEYLAGNATESKMMINILRKIQEGDKKGDRLETEEVVLSKY